MEGSANTTWQSESAPIESKNMLSRFQRDDQPFYAVPASKITSSEIINEAKVAVGLSESLSPVSSPPGRESPDVVSRIPEKLPRRMVIRPVNTKRPFTPKDSERTLFGTSYNTITSRRAARPPSNFSIREYHFNDAESRPVSGVRLLPLESPSSISTERLNFSGDKNPKLYRSADQHFGSKIRLPSLGALPPRPAMRNYNTGSLTNLPEEDEEDLLMTSYRDRAPPRKAFSSPKERTNMSVDEVEERDEYFLAGDSQQVPAAAANFLSKTIAAAQEQTKKTFGDIAQFRAGICGGSDADVVKDVVEEQLAPVEMQHNDASVKIGLSLELDPRVLEITEAIRGIDMDNLDVDAVPQTDALTAKERILVMLEMLNSIAMTVGNDTKVLEILGDLWELMKKDCNTEGGEKHANSVKSAILRTLYKYVERSNEKILLKVAAIILMLRVTGSNLAGVCKLIFKVSRSDCNDKLFLDDCVLELLLEAVGSASPLDDAEACVYGYGALKFLSMNTDVLKKLLELGILELMVLHMKIITSHRREGAIPDQTSHALFQLTGTLRNVAGEEDTYDKFVSTGAVTQLCDTMNAFERDLDIVCNVARTLSILSTDDECCGAIVNYVDVFKCLLGILRRYANRQDVIVRLCYALGNMMAKSELARRLFFGEKRTLDTIIELLSFYTVKDISDSEAAREGLSHLELGSSGSAEDVIVKLIRVIANMCIDPHVGSSISDSEECIEYFLHILHTKTLHDSEELVLSTLSTLNNISFFPGDGGALATREIPTARALYEIACGEHSEGVIEAMRVLGNLTRRKSVRDYFIQEGLIQFLVFQLDTDDLELLQTVVGVLINMMVDEKNRYLLFEDEGVEKLIILLRNAKDNWHLATLLGQALWNCLNDMDVLAGTIERKRDVLRDLYRCLDTSLFEIPHNGEHSRREFEGVGSYLWDRINVYFLSISSDYDLDVSN